MSDEHPEVMVPHDRRDLKRVSLVIAGAAVPLAVVAWRFMAVGEPAPRDLHAGWTFAFGAALLFCVGVAIGIRARRPG